MISQQQFKKELDLIINNAIREDIGLGDYSSLACIPKEAKGKAKLLIKESCTIAGVAFAEMIFKTIDADLKFIKKIDDGTETNQGDVAFLVEGNSQSILKAERFVLNAMQRMSAISTKTAYFVSLLDGTKTKILDTRKTTPGIRAIEKWAVKIGGGVNHRFALYDAIMLKDNHIDFSGRLSEAIEKAKNYLKTHNLNIPIIIEARNLDEVQEINIHEGIHRVLLDNFDLSQIRQAIDIINGKCPIEASGNINEKTIKDYAKQGVDYISCGALTHSVYNVDLSLKAI